MIGLQTGGIYVYSPLIICVLGHVQKFLGIPCTKNIVSSYKSQTVTSAKLGGSNNDANCLRTIVHRHLAWNLLIDAIGEGAAIEISILWHIAPKVIKMIIITTARCHVKTVLYHEPFCLAYASVSLHTIIIGIGTPRWIHTPLA